MTIMKCEHCGNCYHWRHAFSKYGYDCGNGDIATKEVAKALEDAGYEVKYGRHGRLNKIIYSIKKDKWEKMPSVYSGFHLGYSDPIEFLPIEILEILEKEFPTPFLFR